MDHLKRTNAEQAAKVNDTHDDSRVKPDPLKKKTALCLGPNSNIEDQSQCSFISKLPAEVRVMVYHHVMCVPVPVIHVVRRKDGSLCHVRCRALKGECGTYRCYNDYSDLSRTTKTGSPTQNQVRKIFGLLLALPLTCKKVSVPKASHDCVLFLTSPQLQ